VRDRKRTTFRTIYALNDESGLGQPGKPLLKKSIKLSPQGGVEMIASHFPITEKKYLFVGAMLRVARRSLVARAPRAHFSLRAPSPVQTNNHFIRPAYGLMGIESLLPHAHSMRHFN